MDKCAIIQFEPIHEIVTPGIIYSLNQNGFIPTLFFNKECSYRRGNIFEFSSNLKFDLIEFSVKGKYDWDSVKLDIVTTDFKFLVINTLQKNAKLKWYADLNLPIIGIVHNVHILLESDLGHHFINCTDVFLLTIAPHVNFYLRHRTSFDKTNIDYFIPSYLVNESLIERKEYNKELPLKLAIAGGVNNLNNRGFAELLNFLKNRNCEYSVKFIICGGGNDRQNLENLVNKYELSQYFDFVKISKSTGYVMYDDYYHAICNADFLLTLFPQKVIKYFKFKATASIMTATSIDLPIITDDAARTIYGIPCLSYNNQDISTLFDLINRVDFDIYTEQQRRIKLFKEECRLRGKTTFQLAIKCII